MVEDIGKTIINRSNELLGENPEVVRVDPEGKNFTLSSREHANTVATYFRGAELLVSQYIFRYGDVTRSRQDLYVFYPDHTNHIIRHSATQQDSRGLTVFLPRIEPSEITRPASPQELINLLQKITQSHPFKSNF